MSPLSRAILLLARFGAEAEEEEATEREREAQAAVSADRMEHTGIASQDGNDIADEEVLQ